MAVLKPVHFYCEFCGKQVKPNDKICPYCGSFFSKVRCPVCGFEGDTQLFLSGCPACGHMMQSADPARRSAEPGGGTGGKRVLFDLHEVVATELPHKKGKVPPWVKFAIAGLFIAVLVLAAILSGGRR